MPASGGSGQPEQGGTVNTVPTTVGGSVQPGGAAGTRASGSNYAGAGGGNVGGSAGQRSSLAGAGSNGGSTTGGNATGGNATGGNATGGNATGGNATGGNATGGSAVAGASGAVTAGAPSTGGSAGAAGSTARPCPSGRGPDMVRVPEGYCIDKTEVTEGQYGTWIATSPAAIPANQISDCAWNDDYQSVWLRGNAAYPVVGIDWCDAVAFCKWSNKRLCGAIGGRPIVTYGDHLNENISEWFNACTAHGAHVYPYGDTLIDSRCNAGKAGFDIVTTVGQFTRCTSSVAGYTNIFDMSGNVWEWVDYCSGHAADDTCTIVGSSYYLSTTPGVENDPRCGSLANPVRNDWYYDVGIRCCAD
jgi:formylglycine-generating enzyme required for sulfatase activity